MSFDDTVTEQQLRRIADGLEDLNSHILAYLKVMALNLLQPCGPGDDTAAKAREASAMELLAYIEKAKEER